MLALDGAEIQSSVVGRATGSSQIVGTSLLTVGGVSGVLSLRNPAAAIVALTITANAGNPTASPVSAHLVITRYR